MYIESTFLYPFQFVEKLCFCVFLFMMSFSFHHFCCCCRCCYKKSNNAREHTITFSQAISFLLLLLFFSMPLCLFSNGGSFSGCGCVDCCYRVNIYIQVSSSVSLPPPSSSSWIGILFSLSFSTIYHKMTHVPPQEIEINKKSRTHLQNTKNLSQNM